MLGRWTVGSGIESLQKASAGGSGAHAFATDWLMWLRQQEPVWHLRCVAKVHLQPEVNSVAHAK
jgi:hypothetical protein